MTKKLLLALFVSVFLLALVSSLSVSDVSLGTVTQGQTVNFSVVLNNTNDLNNYNVNFSLVSGLTILNTTVNSDQTKVVSASYLVPSNDVGIDVLNVDYTYSNLSGSFSSDFDITLNALASGVLQITSLQALTYSQNGLVRVQNTGDSALNVVLSATGTDLVTFSNKSFTLPADTQKDVEVIASNLNKLKFGSNNIVVTATAGSLSDSVSYNLDKSFCVVGETGSNLTIDNVDISSSGDKDDEWRFLDTITVEVRVKNVGDDDVDNVIVELGLFDSDGSDVSSDLEFSSEDEESIELGDLGDSDKETATFEFRVPVDFDAGNYKLAVKAYSDDQPERELCADESSDLSNTLYESITVEEESDEGKFIGFDNVELSASELTCSESASLSFEAFNVGDEDQDRVKIRLYNANLNIDEIYEIKDDFDSGDSQEITFNFVVPSNAKDGVYDLFLTADYDYRGGVYRQDLDEDFEVPLRVLGCAAVPNDDKIVTISTDYDSVKAGSELVVSATIRNVGDEERSFLVDLEGYSSFAELVSVSDNTLTLDAGESQTIEITLKIDSDAASEESFRINVISDGLTETQDVQLSLEQSRGFSFAGSSLVWIIAGVNLILIILIILVAVKLSRK